MPKAPRKESHLALSPQLIAGILAASIGIAYLLLPDERTLIERLMRDGSYDKALKLSLETRPAKRQRNQRFFTYVDLRCKRMVITNPTVLDRFRLLDQNLRAYQQFGFAPEFFPEIIELSTLLATEEGLHAKLKPFTDKMPRDSKLDLTERLVPLYLANSKPASAAHTYMDYWFHHEHGEERVLEMVKLWRYSQNPTNALRAVDAWLPRQKGLDRPTQRRFDRLRIDLLREQSRAEDAFVATKAFYGGSTLEEQSELFELLTSTALESGHAKEILPEMVERARRFPNDARLWRSILDLSTAEGQLKIAIDACIALRRLDPKDAQVIMRQGQIYEWQDMAKEAFETYLDALKLAVPESVDRLLELNEGLYRDAELADAIDAQPEIARGREISLQVARLMANAGKFTAAKRNFEYAIAFSKGKTEPVLEYGSLLNALFDYEEAMKVFDKAVRANPANLALKAELAENHMRLGNNDKALAVYEEILPHTSDGEILDKIIVLAESAARIDLVRTAIRRKVKVASGVVAEDYMRLDYFDNLVDAIDLAAATVKEGVARFPTHEPLRIQAGYTLTTAKQYKEALAILKDAKTLKTNPGLVQLYLSLLILSQDFKEARAFLNTSVAPEFLALSPIIELRAQVDEAENKLSNAASLLVELRRRDQANVVYSMNHARLLSSTGKIKEAIEIITPHLNSRDPEVLKLAAQVFAAAGEHRKAEMFQRAYLATLPKELPQAWGFLGDIYLSRGSKIEAKRAYKRGLQELIQNTRDRKEAAKP